MGIAWTRFAKYASRASVPQELLPVVDPDPAVQVPFQLVETLPQRRELVCVEGGGELAFDPDHEFLDVVIDLSAGRGEAEAGAAPVVLVDIAADQSAPDQ
jgi:hypothetical protein